MKQWHLFAIMEVAWDTIKGRRDSQGGLAGRSCSLDFKVLELRKSFPSWSRLYSNRGSWRLHFSAHGEAIRCAYVFGTEINIGRLNISIPRALLVYCETVSNCCFGDPWRCRTSWRAHTWEVAESAVGRTKGGSSTKEASFTLLWWSAHFAMSTYPTRSVLTRLYVRWKG